MYKELTKHIVYTLENAQTGNQYIGQTNNLYRRLIQHKNIAKSGETRRLYNAINKYGWDSFRVKEKITCPEYLVDGFEQMLIKAKREDVGERFLYNLDSGGHGNKVCNEETKKKISLAQKGIPDKPYSEERKREISLRVLEHPPMKGKHHTEETKIKMSLAKTKYIISVNDESGNLIGVFTMMKQLCSVLNVDRNRVLDCLKGKRKTHKHLTFTRRNKNEFSIN